MKAQNRSLFLLELKLLSVHIFILFTICFALFHIEFLKLLNLILQIKIKMSVEEEVEEQDFTILPNFLNENISLKKKKDLYRLPEWMSSLAKRFNSGQIQTETTIPINQITYLDEDLRSILINDLSIEHLFPVQSQVIPYLIEQNHSHSPIPPADICVSSPTGSGKTLTYVVPLLQCIRQRVTRAIRIVILLPVQDLAEQVYNVVNQIGSKLQLKTALLAGQHSFEDEQKVLVKQQLNGSK